MPLERNNISQNHGREYSVFWFFGQTPRKQRTNQEDKPDSDKPNRNPIEDRIQITRIRMSLYFESGMARVQAASTREYLCLKRVALFFRKKDADGEARVLPRTGTTLQNRSVAGQRPLSLEHRMRITAGCGPQRRSVEFDVDVIQIIDTDDAHIARPDTPREQQNGHIKGHQRARREPVNRIHQQSAADHDQGNAESPCEGKTHIYLDSRMAGMSPVPSGN